MKRHLTGSEEPAKKLFIPAGLTLYRDSYQLPPEMNRGHPLGLNHDQDVDCRIDATGKI